MQCFAIPFKPLGPKMAKTVSCSNTTGNNGRLVHVSGVSSNATEIKDEKLSVVVLLQPGTFGHFGAMRV